MIHPTAIVAPGAELAEDVSQLLKTRVKKINVRDQMEVAKFADENTTEDWVQIGKQLNVDMLVALDLKRFSLYEGPTLYQGKATDAYAGCPMFAGKQVASKGWCSAYNKKA